MSDTAEKLSEDAQCASRTLLGTDDPAEALERARGLAELLAPVFEEHHLVVAFIDKRGRESRHPKVEAWQMLGSLLGVSAHCTWTRPVYSNDGSQIGWEARCEARTLDGITVGSGEMMCLRVESKWRNADGYAIRSMAQTRSISKALKSCLGWVMPLAGLSSTPAEEMQFEQARGEDVDVVRPAHLSLAQAKVLSERIKHAGVSELDYRAELAARGITKLAELTPDVVGELESWLAEQSSPQAAYSA